MHPDWAGKVIGNFNFELPALSNGNLDGIRSTYEYRDFLEECVKKTSCSDAGLSGRRSGVRAH